jgi:hypothetical protein
MPKAKVLTDSRGKYRSISLLSLWCLFVQAEC